MDFGSQVGYANFPFAYFNQPPASVLIKAQMLHEIPKLIYVLLFNSEGTRRCNRITMCLISKCSDGQEFSSLSPEEQMIYQLLATTKM